VLELSRYPLEVCMNIGFDLENKLPRWSLVLGFFEISGHFCFSKSEQSKSSTATFVNFTIFESRSFCLNMYITSEYTCIFHIHVPICLCLNSWPQLKKLIYVWSIVIQT
jgi:hypothetical protein